MIKYIKLIRIQRYFWMAIDGNTFFFFCSQNGIVTNPISQTLTPWIPMVLALGQQFISQQGVAPRWPLETWLFYYVLINTSSQTTTVHNLTQPTRHILQRQIKETTTGLLGELDSTGMETVGRGNETSGPSPQKAVLRWAEAEVSLISSQEFPFLHEKKK